MLEFARWKYWLVVFVLVTAALIALPNVFGEDYALQVIKPAGEKIDDASRASIENYLREQKIPVKSSYVEDGRLMVRFADGAAQLRARDAVNGNFRRQFNTALSYASRAPDVLRNLGFRPMPLGLDLRGGLYLLYQVDVGDAVRQLLDSYEQDFRRVLGKKELAFGEITIEKSGDSDLEDRVVVALPAGANSGRDGDSVEGNPARSHLQRRECRRRRAHHRVAERRRRSCSARTPRSSRTSRCCAIASTSWACPSR